MCGIYTSFNTLKDDHSKAKFKRAQFHKKRIQENTNPMSEKKQKATRQDTPMQLHDAPATLLSNCLQISPKQKCAVLLYGTEKSTLLVQPHMKSERWTLLLTTKRRDDLCSKHREQCQLWNNASTASCWRFLLVQRHESAECDHQYWQ